MGMALDQSAERHHEVDVFIFVRVPHVRTTATLEHHRAASVNGGSPRRRVHALNQRLLGPLKPLLRTSAAAGRDCVFSQTGTSCSLPTQRTSDSRSNVK